MPTADLFIVGMIVVFFIGYFLITIENIIHINKTAVALIMAIVCWLLQFLRNDCDLQTHMECLGAHLGTISQIIFFLLGALAIVEIISLHEGFKVISNYIFVRSKRQLLWLTGSIAFVLSSILDNLTTTIVMVTLLQKLIRSSEDRLLIGAGIVIAANAGGAWTPIGDVTTTMLWIGGQLSTFQMMRVLFIPSVVCALVSFALLSLQLKGQFSAQHALNQNNKTEPYGRLVFFLGVFALVSVPIFKMLTGLPPYMGVLFGLSVIWFITDFLHNKKPSQQHLKVPNALARVDLSSTLFFLGILLCIDALDAAYILEGLAQWLNTTIGNSSVIATLIGLVSAVVDNVPLVAASMSMYELAQYQQDSHFWNLVAYAAGTGGSILIIGSAAGVMYMGLERANFIWYLKRVSLAALTGYFAGIACYLLLFK